MEKEIVENNAPMQQEAPKDITLNIQGEKRNYKLENMSEDGLNAVRQVISDESNIIPMLQRMFVLASLGSKVEAEAMERKLPSKYDVIPNESAVEEVVAEEVADVQKNGKASN